MAWHELLSTDVLIVLTLLILFVFRIRMMRRKLNISNFEDMGNGRGCLNFLLSSISPTFQNLQVLWLDGVVVVVLSPQRIESVCLWLEILWSHAPFYHLLRGWKASHIRNKYLSLEALLRHNISDEAVTVANSCIHSFQNLSLRLWAIRHCCHSNLAAVFA